MLQSHSLPHACDRIGGAQKLDLLCHCSQCETRHTDALTTELYRLGLKIGKNDIAIKPFTVRFTGPRAMDGFLTTGVQQLNASIGKQFSDWTILLQDNSCLRKSLWKFLGSMTKIQSYLMS